MRPHSTLLLALFALGALAAAGPAIAGLPPYDVPGVTCEGATLSSITLHVCGGAATGAPAGLTIQWKKLSDYNVSGWADDGTLCALSLSGQPSLQHPEKSRWELLAGECEDVEIGDLNFDETGVSGTGCALNPLDCGTDYVFRWFAHAGRGYGRSDWGGELTCSTQSCPASRCTYTQGYWKNHGGPVGCDQAPVNPPDPAWPAAVLSGGMVLGSQTYTADQLCVILNTSGGGGKGLLTLAHQLIAAKLNLANGATGCTALDAAVTLANSQVGNINLYDLAHADCNQCGGRNKPPCPAGCGNTVPSANADLTAFNEGVLNEPCGPHCSVGPPGSVVHPAGATPVRPTTWGKLKTLYR